MGFCFVVVGLGDGRWRETGREGGSDELRDCVYVGVGVYV